MMRGYQEVHGILVKKYRNISGKYVFILAQPGRKEKIFVGKAIYDQADIGTLWSIGHINGRLVNIRPGFCDSSEQ